MNKSTAKELRLLANKLPVTFYSSTGARYVTGFELIENDINELSDGSPVRVADEDGKAIRYISKYDVNHKVNHFKRIKRIEKRGGLPAVMDYVNSQLELYEQSKRGVNLGGIQTENY